MCPCSCVHAAVYLNNALSLYTTRCIAITFKMIDATFTRCYAISFIVTSIIKLATFKFLKK